MTVKKGVRLQETGALEKADLRTAKALSIDTVEEFVDFAALFPDEAAALFTSTSILDDFRSGSFGHGSVSAIEEAELVVLEEGFGHGAIAPTLELAEEVATLHIEEVDGAPPPPVEAGAGPAVHLACHGPVRHQGKRGTCVAHAICAVLECAFRSSGQPPLDLSEQFLYWLCKMNDGAPNASGTWQRVAVPLSLQYGVPNESAWPYNPLKTASQNQGPPPTALGNQPASGRATQGVVLDPRWVEAICAQLDGGRAVGVSVPVFDNWTIALLSGDIPMPIPGRKPSGGHAMCAVGYGFDDGYLGGGYVIVRNSWGTDWGMNSPFGPGHGTLPFAYLRNFGWEAFTVEGGIRP